ncbi:MAG: ubiquinol-cytochrome c reductase iron-sulfur subunit [Chlorobi bacterium]|nr:ubiquinol-cytochrome c reductase iron-sulfur subunit [Chlorobiota bacterium]
MERRDAIKNLLAFVPLGTAFAGITAMGITFITPKKRDLERRIFTLHLEELPINTTKKFRDLRGKDLVLVRTGEREVKAMSTVCTHLGCTVYWEKDRQEFYCPCHQGRFNKDGQVIAGPPPKPLETYKTEISGDNVFIYFQDKEA